MMENVQMNNAPIAVGFSGGPTVLQGGDVLIDNYGNGNNFIQNGQTLSDTFLNGAFSPSAKGVASTSLRSSSGWFARSKPQYQTVGIGGFVDIRAAGAAGNGRTDDTAVINSVLASARGSIVYFPHGTYMVSDTISIPPETKIVGEVWSEIMGFGDKFSDISNPRVMIRVGTAGQTGDVEISDMLFTGKMGSSCVLYLNVNKQNSARSYGGCHSDGVESSTGFSGFCWHVGCPLPRWRRRGQ
jgi:hypothetical protein